jgi:N-acetylmuramoyl-L-alanine amidase
MSQAQKAQESTENSLSRVSTAARSDGQGYVVRFHLSQKADSFQVYQPEPHLVQFALFGPEMNPDNIRITTDSPAFSDVTFDKIPNGLGVNVSLRKEEFLSSSAYRDGQSDDILLGLTSTEQQTLADRTGELEPVSWSQNEAPAFLAAEEQDTNSRSQNTSYNNVRDKMKFDVVVLDPGHGGHDTGAMGHGGIREKDIVLDISKKVGKYIEDNMPGVKVVYTRNDDSFIELEERGSIANRHEGDLFVSIHCNAARSRQAHGSEVYFLGLERSKTALEVMKRENKVVRANDDVEQKKLSQEELLIYELANSGYISTSESIAGMLEHQFDDRAQRRSRGVKQARFVVLYHASMPAVLVETGFISNPDEGRYLTTEHGQNIMASAIFRAIRDYKEKSEKTQHVKTR